MSKLNDITYKAMMGEYIIYYRSKVVGGIYDNRFLVKPVKSAIKLMPHAEYELPKEVNKSRFLIFLQTKRGAREMKQKTGAILLPIRCIVFILVFVIGSIITGKDFSEISNWWSVAATVVNIFTILLLVVLARKENKTYWELMNFQKGQTKLRQVVGITLIVLAVGMAGMYLAGYICYGIIPYGAPMLIAPIPKVLAAINVLLLPVTTAFAEDGLYLGYGVNHIENKSGAILIPAFFFALQHSFIPVLFDARYIIYRFVSFLPLTVILCWYYYKKRNPLPIVIGHTLIDVATAVQILVTSFVPGVYEMMCEM